MTHPRWWLPAASLVVFASTAVAQPGFGPGGSGFPEVGTTIPDVTVYDDQGQQISTKDLRGHYSVLVFGCLT